MSITRRAFGALAAAGLFARPAAAARSALLDAMVAFDAVYIPALSLTQVVQQDAAAAPRALAAMQRLHGRWPALRVALEIRKPADWSATFEAVARQIDAADAAVALSNWPAAHDALEPVRSMLLKARESAGVDYFPDRLARFHEPMELLASAGARGLVPISPPMRSEIERAFAEARAHWRGIEQNLPEAADHRMSSPRFLQFKSALADGSKALTALSDALRGSDDAALLKAARAIKPPFARLYTAFGAAADETLDP